MRSLIKSILIPAITFAFSALALQACGSGQQSGGTCVPNSTQSCLCTDGNMGVQTCQASGVYDTCTCGGGSSSSSGMGGGGGSGGGSICDRPANTPPTCGNGTVDMGEECDDGNCVANDTCNNNCKLPYCGDGIVQAPEVCDGDEMCPGDCGIPASSSSSSSSGMVDPCVGKLVVAGFAAAQKGAFAYNGQIGLDAAAAACQALGGFGMCDYDQWQELENNAANHAPDNMKLAALIPSGTCVNVWLQRTTDLAMCPHGVGGRCNDWNYETNHISDGEYTEICNMAGTITYKHNLDCDPIFDPMDPAPHQNQVLTCNVARIIPCCYEKCIPMSP